MRLMFPKGKTFPLLSRYVGVSLPDITQSMRFVPFLQPFQRFWMTLRTRIQNSTSADLPSFSESFTNQTGQFLTFTSESGTSPGVRLFNWAKGRMKTFTSEGGMASRVPTAAVSESGMLNYFCLRIRPICYPFWNSWGRNVINNRLLDLLFRQAALSLVPLGLLGANLFHMSSRSISPPCSQTLM